MSMWGPAAEAEIEYRQAEVRKAWSGRRTSRTDRVNRAARRSERRAERRSKRPAHVDRAEQISAGIAGMRPATGTRRGLFA